MPAPGRRCGLSRRLIDKAGYCGQARARDGGEVGALGDDRASLRGQLPAEADAVVMPIDRPGAAETVAGKTLLHGPHHAIVRSNGDFPVSQRKPLPKQPPSSSNAQDAASVSRVRGRQIVNSVNSSTLLSTSIVPPCCCTTMS